MKRRKPTVKVFAALSAVAVVAVMSIVIVYAHFVSDKMYEESTQHLEEVYTQVNATFKSLVSNNWNRLSTWGCYIRDASSAVSLARSWGFTGTVEDTVRSFVEGEKERWNFTEFYFLNDAGSYVTVGGERGHLDLGSKLSDLAIRRENIVMDGALSNNESLTAFAIPISLGTFDGFDYTAIAVTYNNEDMEQALDVSTFSGSSDCFVVQPDGRVLLSATATPDRPFNYLAFLRDKAEILDGDTIEDVQRSLEEGGQGVVRFALDDTTYYLVYLPAGFQDWMMLGIVPDNVVNASMSQIQWATVAMVSIVFLAVGVFLASALILRNRRVVSERVALELARQSNEAKSSFLAKMSHDIRTPINAIMGMAQIAQDHLGDIGKTRKCLETISISSEHLLGLINDVLDVSKIESNAVELQEAECDLDEVLNGVDALIRPVSDAKGQCFTIDSAGAEHRSFAADGLRLRQILLNLLSNAVKYTPEGGKISLTVAELEQADARFARLRFVVRDNGMGIAPEFIENLFAPFERANDAEQRGIQGTGLGMTITKALVDAMGGTIDVESAVNKGTTFTVVLEFRLDEGCASALVPNLRTGGDGAEGADEAFRGKRLLVVEDNEINRMILVELLSERGATAEEAENGEEAVRAFASNEPGHFDAIFMDAMMPVMNGYEATRAIRALAPDRADAATVPIVALTANAYANDVQECLDAGMNAHVGKPFNINDLARALIEVMR